MHTVKPVDTYVQVQSVIEAALRIRSGGGDVALGSVRASDAAVETSGGALTGSITAFSVDVDTGGGAVALKRLVGRKAEIRSRGGDVELNVVYGDSVNISSGDRGQHHL